MKGRKKKKILFFMGLSEHPMKIKEGQIIFKKKFKNQKKIDNYLTEKVDNILPIRKN